MLTNLWSHWLFSNRSARLFNVILSNPNTHIPALKLQFLQSKRILSLSLFPPKANGILWSYSRFFMVWLLEQRPLVLWKAARLTSVGMVRLFIKVFCLWACFFLSINSLFNFIESTKISLRFSFLFLKESTNSFG